MNDVVLDKATISFLKRRKQQAEELWKAIYAGDECKVLSLLKNTEKPEEIRFTNDDTTLLHWAAAFGMTDVCQVLVEQYQIATEEKDSIGGWTALHMACRENHTDTVKYLVTHAYCDPLVKDRKGCTPLSSSTGEISNFLQYIIDQTKKQGFTKVPIYTKAFAMKERQLILDKAMAEGEGDLHQCNIVFHGPPGAGKSSVKALMLGKPPRPKNKQTATDIVENCVRTVSMDRVAATSDQQGFEEVDNDDIITRIIADVEKYRREQTLRETNPHYSPTAADSSHKTHPEESSSDSAVSDDGIMSVLESPSGDRPPSTQHTETLESIRAGLLRFSSSYKPMFDSRWLHHIDSGGQPQYLDTFPLMYRTPNSHFVFVTRLTDGLDERPKVRFYIEGNDKYCLPDHLVLSNREMIIRMCQVARRISRATGGKFTPRVFVVGTHYDKLTPLRGLIRRRHINSELLRIHEEFKDVLVCKSREQVMFMVNAMAKGKERQQYTEELQKHILLATENSGDPTKVPLKWLVYHLELEKCADVVRMEKCLELAEAVGVPRERVRAALEFLNKAALVMYYPDDVPDLVITKMDPFTSRLSKLIKASFIAPDSYGPTNESDELREKGVFKKSFLQRVFRDVADNLISDEEFLKLLESLKIAVHIGGDKYFLPSALSLKPPSDESTSFNSNSTPLALWWDELILPHGFFLTVSVELQNKTGGKEGYVFELQKDMPQWRGAIQLSEATHEIIPGVVMLTDKQRWIEVAYSGPNTYCPKVRQAVVDATERAVKRLQHTGIDSPRIGSTCPLCKSKDHYCTITKDRNYITCSSKTVSVTPSISCWFEGGTLIGNGNKANGCDKQEIVSQSIDDSYVFIECPPSIPPLIEVHVDEIDDLKDPLDVFNGHTPEIMGVVSDTDSLMAGLVSEGILPEHDTTTDGTISRYHRVDKLMKTVQSCLEKSSNPKEILVKFSVVLMKQDNETLKRISTDIKSQLILSRRPNHFDVLETLSKKASHWSDIGRKLKVNYDFRESVMKQGVQTTDQDKLEQVLNKWIESCCSEVSWHTVLRLLKDLEYYDLLKSTRKWMKEEEVLRKYLNY